MKIFTRIVCYGTIIALLIALFIWYSQIGFGRFGHFIAIGVVVAIFIGLIPAFIARSKGRDFSVWWVYGVFLFPFALLHAILASQVDRLLVKPQKIALTEKSRVK